MRSGLSHDKLSGFMVSSQTAAKDHFENPNHESPLDALYEYHAANRTPGSSVVRLDMRARAYSRGALDRMVMSSRPLQNNDKIAESDCCRGVYRKPNGGRAGGAAPRP